MDIVKIIDIVIAVLLIAAVITGYITGFVMKVANLAVLVASYFIALMLANMLSPQLEDYINGQVSQTPVAFAGGIMADTAGNLAHNIVFSIILVISFIILHHVVSVLKVTSHIPVIGKIDRICGAIAGFFIDFIVIYIIFSIFFSVVPQETLDGIGLTKEAIGNSVLLQAFYKEDYL